MNKTKQKTGCMQWNYENGKTTGCPTVVARETFGHDRCGGFTLVELVIVIAIVIILSVISVPIYRGYVDKSKMAEGYALLGTVLSAQKTYYSEYGNFLRDGDSTGGGFTNYDPVLGIDARGNKYFTQFYICNSSCSNKLKIGIFAQAMKPVELQNNGWSSLQLYYNITKGAKITEQFDNNWLN